MEEVSQCMERERDLKNERVKAYCEVMVEILTEKHSIAALEIVVEMGYKIEFEYNDVLYEIYLTKDKLLLVCPSLKLKIGFKFMEDLIMYSMIDGKHFIDIWDEIEIKSVHSMV